MSRGQELLSAYHDGELRGLRRWWLQRQLRRSPELQRELAELEELSALLREVGEELADAEFAPMAEVWPGIASRLSVVDARRRAEATEAAAGGFDWSRIRGPSLVAGALAVAVIVLAIAPQLMHKGLPAEPGAGGALRYLDTGGRPVMVSEGREETTIIWLMDLPGDAV